LAPAVSACAAHGEWIEAQVQLGRNAMSIYQDLVEQHGFTHRYNSVKRFVAKLRAREPERFDVLEFLPGEEAQVDFGQGAPTLYKPGRYKRPWLFVMTLKYSGKSFSQNRLEGRSTDVGTAARGGVSRAGRQPALCRPRQSESGRAASGSL
jgi:transposase